MRKFKCTSTRFPKNFTVGKIYLYEDGITDNGGFCYSTLNPIGGFYDTKFEEVFDKEEKIMKFDLKNRKEKIAILCDTKEKADKFVEFIKQTKDFKVCNDKSYYRCKNQKNLKFLIPEWSDSVSWDSENYANEYGYKTITFEEFMREKEDVKMEFKVGDRVEILGGTKQKDWDSDDTMKKYIGTKGSIERKHYYKDKFKVRLDLDNDYWFFNKEDLKLASNNQSQQFTITISDSVTTLETNDKIVEIKRYHTDKHDVEIAMQEVIDRYFMEVRKEEKDAGLPKVGDKVKVVDDGKTHDTYDEWLIKNNVNLKSAIKWRKGLSPKNGGEYTIKEIHKHEYYDVDLALIEDGENAYIINIKGLEVIK